MIFKQLNEQLVQLVNLLQKINSTQYTFKSKYLDKSSIGGHTRHIIELLNCTINGYQTGIIDYIKRDRNLLLENDIELALKHINKFNDLNKYPDKLVQIKNDDGSLVSSSYYREIVYNIEHIIHHLALIKVSVIEMELNIIDENFGFAYSTLQYKFSLQNV